MGESILKSLNGVYLGGVYINRKSKLQYNLAWTMDAVIVDAVLKASFLQNPVYRAAYIGHGQLRIF